MSYATALALQEAVYHHLSADPALTTLVGGAIHDSLPPGPIANLYVVIGAEDVREAGDQTGCAARHEITISVIGDTAGFARAKAAAVAVSDALTGADLALARGTLVYLNFHRARARRVQDAGMRRIDLRFRALIEDS